MSDNISGAWANILKDRSIIEIILIMFLLGGSTFSIGSLTKRIPPEEVERRINLAVQATKAEEQAKHDFEDLQEQVEENTITLNSVIVAIDSLNSTVDAMKRQMTGGFSAVQDQLDNLKGQ